MRKNTIPAKTLRIALLDDDEDGYSSRFSRLRGYKEDEGWIESWDDILVTDKFAEFKAFVDNGALAFCDPGALGELTGSSMYRNNDRELSAYLREHPSQVLYVPYNVCPSHYVDVETFKLSNCSFFDASEMDHYLSMIIGDWLFENNPVRLFCWGWRDFSDAIHYLKKLREPALSAVCDKLCLSPTTVGCLTAKERRQAIYDHYFEVHREHMKKRGIIL
jgi:hypothetical protein